MILLHRLTPFAIAFLGAAGFIMLILAPFSLGIPALICFGMILALFARLLVWDVRRTGFWVFLGMPLFLLASSLAFFLLLENDGTKWVLGAVVTLGLTLFAESLFSFYHLPSTYQAYSLEYLSLMLAVGGLFFITSATYLAQLFLEAPVWAMAILIALIIFAVFVAVFWVSKMSWEAGRMYAGMGALLLAEIYLACSWLPTGYTTNAAVFAICAAWYLIVMRAHAFQKVTGPLLMRHSAFAAFLILLLFLTTPWR
ncbi:hypothetical protein EBT31_17145 [bacterium]|nr:hypothetical protein [bacterium]NBX50022.1 hypothetical protein [bacterium]